MKRRSLLALFCIAPLAAQATATGDDRHARIYDLQPVYERMRRDTDPARLPTDEDAANLARLVGAFVQPPLADNEVVQALGERWIVVLARAEQHAWAARFLDAAFTQGDDPWTVTVQLLALPEVAFQRDVAPALKRAPDLDAVPRSVVLEPGNETDAFLAALQKHEAVEQLSAPRLLQQALSLSTVSLLNQTAYVKDFAVEVAQGIVVADPVIDVIQDGFVVRTSIVPLGKGVTGLSIDATVSDLQQPIPTFETTLGVGQPVTIQLPQVLRTEVETAAELPADHRLLMVLPPIAGTRHLVIAQVERVGARRPQKAK